MQIEKKKDELKTLFNVNGIPHLVLMDADTGKILCNDATKHLESDFDKGEDFPYESDD